MTDTARPLAADDGPLSPWWLRSVLIVMALGFCGLIAITLLAYRNAPPIPARVVDEHGATLFTGADIGDGQAVFLRYGLMSNGSIWGHGAYLGPDYSALALHRMGEHTAQAIAQQHYQLPPAMLSSAQQAAVAGETTVTLKTNRYDATTATLHFVPSQAATYRQEIDDWTDYFRQPAGNGGLQADLINNPT